MEMNKWYVDMVFDWSEKDGDQVWFNICHYVGGEDPVYVHSEWGDQLEAMNECAEMNKAGITYEFNCFEDDCKLVINGLEPFEE